MKVVALVSGGKDSCYAMMRCIDYGHEVSHFDNLGRIPDELFFHKFDGPSVDLQIVALANLMPLDDSVDELDSYMYQTVSLCYVRSTIIAKGIATIMVEAAGGVVGKQRQRRKHDAGTEICGYRGGDCCECAIPLVSSTKVANGEMALAGPFLACLAVSRRVV
ncbi:hypothetical protein GW17_00041423 [Ensete ventricosum]|nr:hypothetical protein GW17_00041423 [Ensete ventricosum]